ncbi:hypothetical protein CR513_55567, partial [Mucuna pruriens]
MPVQLASASVSTLAFEEAWPAPEACLFLIPLITSSIRRSMQAASMAFGGLPQAIAAAFHKASVRQQEHENENQNELFCFNVADTVNSVALPPGINFGFFIMFLATDMASCTLSRNHQLIWRFLSTSFKRSLLAPLNSTHQYQHQTPVIHPIFHNNSTTCFCNSIIISFSQPSDCTNSMLTQKMACQITKALLCNHQIWFKLQYLRAEILNVFFFHPQQETPVFFFEQFSICLIFTLFILKGTIKKNDAWINNLSFHFARGNHQHEASHQLQKGGKDNL